MTKKLKLLLIIGSILLLIGGFLGYGYFKPKNDTLAAHHHFRLQLIVEGEQLDFSKSDFQEDYVKGQCSFGVTETPIHFHDEMDQIVHIHWDKITGGQVLKYYGLNLIGGDDDSFVYQPTRDIKPVEVPIKGDYIPEVSTDSKLWVYVGDENDFELKDYDKFLNDDLEKFFNKKSGMTIQREELEQMDLTNYNSIKVFSQEQKEGEMNHSKSDEELEKLQNLIGNVVVFVQNEEPTKEEISQRFDNLQPLMDSVCGG